MANHRDDAARPDAAATPRPAKIIKRYSNRKLYDTDRSKYVTLDEIAKMIKAGEEVTIIDNETKEDLTSVTLTQIIFEEEKRESRMPLSMLRNLIQTGGETLQEFFDRSVKAPVVEIKDTAQKRVEELKHDAATLRDAATRSVSEWTDKTRRVFSRSDVDKRAEEFKTACTESLDALAKNLQDRIRDLNEREPAPADGSEKPAETTAAEAADRAHAKEEIASLKLRLAEITSLVDELEKSAQR
jgi:polyhydroxyalkanoate synthesis repressor PhaR